MVMRQTKTRRLTFVAANANELILKLGNISILPGSTGRIELQARRVFGVCPIPLGPLIVLPFAGSTWANALSPAGAVVTKRGGIANFGPDCDAFVEWTIPATQAQSAAMSIRLFLLGPLGIAIGAALGILRWNITRIRLVIDAVVDDGTDLTGEELLSKTDEA